MIHRRTNQIEKTLLDSYSDMTPQAFLERIQADLAAIPARAEKASIEITNNYDGPGDLRLSYMLTETEEEAIAREAEEAEEQRRLNERNEQREREQYLRLKTKFEGNHS